MKQFQPATDFVQHLPAGSGAAAGWLNAAQESVQLVEVELADLVDALSRPPKPTCLPTRSSRLSFASGSDRIPSRIRLDVRPGAGSPVREQCG